MTSYLDSYTTKEIGKVVEVSPLSLMTVEPFTEEATNSGVSLMFPNSWLFRIEPPRVVISGNLYNGFIGILTDEEAESMKEDLKLFKKRFNDDFARKNKILFGY